MLSQNVDTVNMPISTPDTKQDVLRAAVEIAETDGVGAIGLREAARRAGVTHGAPYRHFENQQALDRFINSGWDADADATAAAKAGKKGGAYDGAISVSPGVWVYQLIETGLALEATLQGTKYSKADELN